ncbi:hypothetical protein PAMP_020444 [Pampus punctatissimus]
MELYNEEASYYGRSPPPVCVSTRPGVCLLLSASSKPCNRWSSGTLRPVGVTRKPNIIISCSSESFSWSLTGEKHRLCGVEENVSKI